MNQSPGDANDPFAPDFSRPNERVFCLHCNGSFEMHEVVYEERFGGQALWRCPNPECSGAGLGFDLFTEPWWR
jgi:hypothetical protein